MSVSNCSVVLGSDMDILSIYGRCSTLIFFSGEMMATHTKSEQPPKYFMKASK